MNEQHTKMSFECVMIKEEPKFEPEPNEEKSNNIVSKFISFKNENSEIQPPASEIRVKQESSTNQENENQEIVITTRIKLEPLDTAVNEESRPEVFELQPEPVSSSNDLHPQLLPTGRFSCPLCQKLFKTKGHALRHIQGHTIQNLNDTCPKLLHDGLFSCSICQKSFANKYHANRHTLIHNRQKYKCPRCDKTFNKEALLHKHITKAHATKCKKCDQTFLEKADLVKHKKSHTIPQKVAEKTFCPVCNKSFNQPGLLKPHMRKHTGEKPFICNICKKSFAHKQNVQRHELRHKKVKITICYICKKQFPKESHLKYHMRTHISEKYFDCNICKKKFSHKKNIVRHYMRKHPGESYKGDLTDAAVASKVWKEVLNKKEGIESDFST